MLCEQVSSLQQGYLFVITLNQIKSNQVYMQNLIEPFTCTGCFGMTAKKYEFIAQAKKQHISWDRCPFLY